jgi:hypothetical protein
LIHRVIDGRLIHIQDKVLMTRGIVRSRDLHLEVREGLGAPRQERAEPCGSPHGGSSHFS